MCTTIVPFKLKLKFTSRKICSIMNFRGEKKFEKRHWNIPLTLAHCECDVMTVRWCQFTWVSLVNRYEWCVINYYYWNALHGLVYSGIVEIRNCFSFRFYAKSNQLIIHFCSVNLEIALDASDFMKRTKHISSAN